MDGELLRLDGSGEPADRWGEDVHELSGEKISGHISGNAATVTNGVYTTGSYADPGWMTSLSGAKISGNISGSAGSVAWTNVSGRPTNVSAFTNDSGYLASSSLLDYTQ